MFSFRYIKIQKLTLWFLFFERVKKWVWVDRSFQNRKIIAWPLVRSYL